MLNAITPTIKRVIHIYYFFAMLHTKLYTRT